MSNLKFKFWTNSHVRAGWRNPEAARVVGVMRQKTTIDVKVTMQMSSCFLFDEE
jgi:hypothetical protein